MTPFLELLTHQVGVTLTAEFGASSLLTDRGRGDFEGGTSLSVDFVFRTDQGDREGSVTAFLRASDYPGVDLAIEGESVCLDRPRPLTIAKRMFAAAWSSAGSPSPVRPVIPSLSFVPT